MKTLPCLATLTLRKLKGRKTPVDTIKEMLEQIRREIEEYKRRENIYDIMTEDGKEFEMDFQFTVNGEPNVPEFIKKMMGKD